MSAGKPRVPPHANGLTVDALLDLKHSMLAALHPGIPPRPLPSQSARMPVQVDHRSILIGRDPSGRPVYLDERSRLQHMHAIGATGSGKSKMIENCVRQDILAERGVCVVDPHGNHPQSLYRSLLIWLHETGLAKRRKIHLIDPNALSHTIGFNPLDRGDTTMQYSVIAEAMYEAFERMWGDEDGNTKPTIQRVLTATFTALGEQGLTLAEARLLFDPDDAHGIRARVLEKLEDIYAHDEIEYLHGISAERTGRRDFRQEVIGPINRIAKLVRTEAVRVIVGQTDHVIDLREAMDEGHIILANLSGGGQVYEQGADLLGRLLTRFLFFHARRRKNTDRAFFVYLDECHRYVSGDLPNLLAEIRKYGVGVTLAHQWLAQLGRADDPIREAICKGPNIKAVFRIKDPREGTELAEAVMRLNLEQPVHALIKPTVVGHRRTIFRSTGSGSHQDYSQSFGESLSVNRSRTIGTSESDTTSESEADSVSHSTSESVVHSFSRTEGSSDTDSESASETSGTSEGDGGSLTDTAGSSYGRNANSSDTYLPSGNILIADPHVSTSRGNGDSSGENVSRARGSNWQRGNSESLSSTIGTAHGTSESETEGVAYGRTTGETVGKTITRGTARAIGRSEAETKGISIGESKSRGSSTGTSRTEGMSEGIEPIYANLPTAVHGKENVLYMAAQELLSLQTGTARLAYVGDGGRHEYLLQVPNINSTDISDDHFDKLRQRTLEASSSAIPMLDAVTTLRERERSLKQDAESNGKESDAAHSFRVPLRKNSEA